MFTDDLRAAADDIWAAQHEHPFVHGIGDGSLPVVRFAHYVRQDHVFLVDYARLLALGAARAPDVATMRRFAELTKAILGEELDLHRAAAAELGIAAGELAAEPPAPGTAAYTDFLLRTAALGDFAVLVAALLPCMWGYHEIGTRLAAGPLPATRAGSRCTRARTSARWRRGAVGSPTPSRRRPDTPGASACARVP